MMESRSGMGYPQTSLLDVLDKVLDKGLVVAGDIRVSLANVELLTIKIRLLVCSIDKAQEIGLDWWRRDGFLTSEAQEKTESLIARLETLEKQLTSASERSIATGSASRSSRKSGSRTKPKV